MDKENTEETVAENALDSKFKQIEENIEESNNQDLQEPETTEVEDSKEEENDNQDVEEDITFDILNEKFFEELEGYKTKAQELETQNKALLKQLNRLIMKEGAVISRDDNERNEINNNGFNTSAERFNKSEQTIETLRGKLF